MVTTILTAEITITGDDVYAPFAPLEELGENYADGLLDSCGFPEGLGIKIKIMTRTIT